MRKAIRDRKAKKARRVIPGPEERLDRSVNAVHRAWQARRGHKVCRACAGRRATLERPALQGRKAPQDQPV